MTTNQVTLVEPSAQVIDLSHALLLWTSKTGSVKDIGHASLHEVKEGKIQPCSDPLTLKQLHMLNTGLQGLAAKTGARKGCQVLPANLIATEPQLAMTAWWRKSAASPQFFKCEELGQIQGVVNMPSLVFQQIGRSLAVCAIRGNDRPTVDTLVCHAPMFNTYECGGVCLGAVQMEPIEDYSVIPRNEREFLCGVSTHPNGSHRKSNYPTGLFALWRDLIAKPETPWDDDWLVPMGTTTLGQWLERKT